MKHRETGEIEAAGAEFTGLKEYPIGVWRPRSQIYRAAARLVLGPDHFNRVDVKYHKVKVPLADTKAWPRLHGADTNASPLLRRTWMTAACLGIDGDTVDKVTAHYGEENVVPAVAKVTRGGDVVAGPLAGADFGELKGQNLRRTVLMRTGPVNTTTIAAVGIAVPEEGKLYLPDPHAADVMQVLAPTVHLDRLTGWAYATTPVV